jgi:hypothetical protein
MPNLRPEALRDRALTLLTNREGASDLLITHGACGIAAGRDAKLFRYYAASRNAPNERPVEIVLDADLEEVAVPQGDSRDTMFHPRDFEIDRSVLRRLNAEGTRITVKPPENDVTLRYGDTFAERISVFIPKTTPDREFDIYLLADTTGSMTPVLDAVKESSTAIVTALQGLGLDVAFGVGNYKDFGDDVPFQHQLSPTAIVDDVRAAIAAWNADGGGNDAPEAQLFALNQIAENPATGWRQDAKKVVVWFGDAPGHEPICAQLSGLPHEITVGSLIGLYASLEIVVVAISTSTDFGGLGLDLNPNSLIDASDLGAYSICGAPGRGTSRQASRLTSATGGILLSDVQPSEIAAAIIMAVSDIVVGVQDVELRPNGDAARFVSDLEGPVAGPLTRDGLTVNFDVAFTGTLRCADGPQVFEGSIDVFVDNEVKTNKALRVTVPACTTVQIQDSPTAAVQTIAWRPHAGNWISVLARGMEGQLRRCFHRADPRDAANWSWEDLGRPSNTMVDDTPCAIASLQETGDAFLFGFVRGTDGELYQRAWDGRQWTAWSGDGQPYWRADMVANPTAVAFRRLGHFDHDTQDWDPIDRLAVFVWGSNEQLYHYFQGWHSHGTPGVNVVCPAGAAHAELYRVYAYVVGNDRHLYVRHSTDLRAESWAWVDLGMPEPGLLWLRKPGIAIYYFDGRWRLYTFSPGSDGHLWCHTWLGREPLRPDPGAGNWANQGTPGADVRIFSGASAITAPSPDGAQQLYAFVRGDDDHLYVNFWDAAAATWRWRDLGHPENTTVRSEPAAVFCHGTEADRIYVFVRGGDHFLHVCHMDSAAADEQWVRLSRE